jgi:hypothetical protein
MNKNKNGQDNHQTFPDFGQYMVPRAEQIMSTLPEHLMILPVFVGVHRARHHILSKVRKCLVVVLSILILIHLCFCSWVSVKCLVVFIPRHTKWPGIM